MELMELLKSPLLDRMSPHKACMMPGPLLSVLGSTTRPGWLVAYGLRTISSWDQGADFTSDPPLAETLHSCSKDGQDEGQAADIAHQPISQVIDAWTH